MDEFGNYFKLFYSKLSFFNKISRNINLKNGKKYLNFLKVMATTEAKSKLEKDGIIMIILALFFQTGALLN
jgi:hypothetical protein